MSKLLTCEPAYLGAGFGAISIFVILSIISQKMDIPGSLVGGLIASCLFLGGGFPMLGVLGLFFLLGVGATEWKKREKQEAGLAQENEGKRSVRHAIANGGIGAIYALVAIFVDNNLMLLAMVAGSFASATADTLASELGNIYGRSYVNILTFRQDVKGKDGVVSKEGTLMGAIGSLLIASFFGWVYQAWEFVPLIAIAGCLGNVVDSILGATLQQQGILTNDKVNFLSTWVAACIVLLLTYLI